MAPVNVTWQIALLRHPKIESWCADSAWRVRMITTTGTIVVSALIVVIAYLVPGFDKVMGLLGAFFAFMISAIFPLVCHLRLFQNSMSIWRKSMTYILVIVSVIMAATGTWKSFA